MYANTPNICIEHSHNFLLSLRECCRKGRSVTAALIKTGGYTVLDCVWELFGIKNQCYAHLWQTVYVILLAYSKQTQSDSRIRRHFIKAQNIMRNFTGTKMIKMVVNNAKLVTFSPNEADWHLLQEVISFFSLFAPVLLNKNHIFL